jgi:hypothetical protein
MTPTEVNSSLVGVLKRVDVKKELLPGKNWRSFFMDFFGKAPSPAHLPTASLLHCEKTYRFLEDSSFLKENSLPKGFI